ncbi:hypothetical protein Psfp_02924 [Pelotomaculum sp. FP]|uniref:fibronectin type III domain-containing protein n=1 Tax=Pelotomaculum sp. FP TaxID=261474 RepID=UPI0010668151|nr:fibronectin type III domain-containing protein [Pelotomaculum sp. FP]TEB14421.1 hypothetical protein Psfp_02924 [Pelotomaculum sp. FP]
MENSLIRPDPGEFFEGQKMDSLLNFYGVVKDTDTAAVEGAVVIICSCHIGGTERSLGSTFTDREGMYFISIPKIPDYHGLIGFKVRAGKAYILPYGVDNPVNLRERPDEEWAPEEEILDDKTVGVLAERHADDPVTEGETDESRNVESGIEKAADEYTKTREEKGLTVSLSRVDENSLPVVVAPTVQTDAATNVSPNAVTLNGRINNTNWEHCDQRKFRIREQGNESWTDAGIETGSFGPESFSFTITGLIPDATYEFKAMAHNLAGWGEGSVTTFTATFPEAPVQVTAAEAESSRRNLRWDTEPQKTPYDMYRSNYWHWLDNKRYDRSKNPQRQ